ncbi:MAG: diaminopimelate decarboxylase [Alphaproteobacteria bacterium]|nr:diaminopimelate decarboxylase [Alphaproteobacteria bacterium]
MTKAGRKAEPRRRKGGETAADQLRAIRVASDHLDVAGQGELLIEGGSARDLVARFGSPLFVLSDATLRANYRRIRSAFEAQWPQPVNVMYAIKCNPSFAVRAVLHHEGAGGDCFGIGELEATFAGGADPERIALNGSAKSDALIARAIELGVAINMDDEEEPARIEAIAAAAGKRVRVLIRLKIVPPEYADYESDLVNFKGDFRPELERLKWGVTPGTAGRMIEAIRGMPHIDLAGYHSHLGRLSQRKEHRAAYDGEIGRVAAQLFRETGFAPRIIDLGGGWPRERDAESKSLERNRSDIEDYARASCRALRAPLEEAGIALPDLWLEPGRYIAGNAGVLLTTVNSVKRDGGHTWLNVDASTNLMPLLGNGMEGTLNHVIAASRMHEPLAMTADVVGPICIPSVMGAGCRMPELRAGDLIAILDAGMYTESDAHNLNWMPKPATVMVRGSEAGLVRAGETYEHMFRTQRLPVWLRQQDGPASRFRDAAIKGGPTP